MNQQQPQVFGQSVYLPYPVYVQQQGYQAYPVPIQYLYPPVYQPPGQDPSNPPMSYDQENQFDFEFDDASIRRGFIRKVYSILATQLMITFGIISVFVFHEPTKNWVQHRPALLFVALAVFLVTMIALACCESVRRSFPMNFIFLGLFTLAQSFMLGVVSSQYDPDIVLMAVGITTAVCLGLTLFAFQTKWDFTVMGGVLLVAAIILLVFGIVTIFIPGKTMQLVYASCGVFLFCIYLIYDTQLMMGGKHKYSISPEEYIFAALNLYMDIMLIFQYILMILGITNN